MAKRITANDLNNIRVLQNGIETYTRRLENVDNIDLSDGNKERVRTLIKQTINKIKEQLKTRYNL